MSSLAGNSRSGGTTNWIHYVASKYDASVVYSLERKGKLTLFDLSLDRELKTLSPSDKIKILDEIIETDSTVTITFNMTVKNPLMYETKEK